MSIKFWWIISALLLLIPTASFSGTLSCTVATSCPSGIVPFKMSDTTSAHAELPNQTNYAQLVCCTGVSGLANSCSNGFGTVLKLSDVTNAHVEQNTFANYGNNACLSVPTGGTVIVGYQGGSCTGFDTVLASMSDTSNAQVGNAAAYSTKICASADLHTPTFIDTYITTDVAYTQSDNTGGSGGVLGLIGGGTKLYRATGTVEDLDGASNIQSVSLVFHRSGQAASCTADNNTCYRTNCTIQSQADPNQMDYNCPFDLAFYADSTSAGGAYPSEDWIVELAVIDNESAKATNTSLHKEVATLLAVSIPSSVSYGTLALAESTTNANNQQMNIEQLGNDEADVEVSTASAMSCATRGIIPLANQRWSLADVSYGDQAATALSTTPADTNLNLGYRTDDAQSLLQSLYWNILIPTSGIEGVCSGTTVVTAIAH